MSGLDFTPWPAEFAERYRAKGYWQGITFGEMLRAAAKAYGDRTAVVGGDVRWTYAELDALADRTAAGFLGLGVKKGDRVVVQLPNIPDYFAVVFALFRIGALPVFALPAHRENEIAHFCAATEAVAFVTTEENRELAGKADLQVVVAGDLPSGKLQPFTEPDASDVAFLQLSGGSTGIPKLIPRTHDDYFYSVRASADICGLSPESVYLVALPVSHNFTMSSPGVLGVLYAGGTVVLAPSPDPKTAFGLIEKERVTITSLVPPLALLWLDADRSGHDLTSLQTLQVGGAKFAEESAKRVAPELGCRLQQVFGMAEGLVNYTRDEDPDDIVTGTQGLRISADDKIRIVDDADVEVADGEVGHLLTRGPYTIRGYYRADAHNVNAFTADGFYRTGDLVRMTPTGHLVVEGRAKDQINRGGDKIAPEEVENHLLAHPDVHDVAVVAVPDDYLGERTCAFVIVRPGRKVTVPQVKAFIRDRGVAAYKIPDKVRFVESFPYTGVGKTSRKDLRAALSAQEVSQ